MLEEDDSLERSRRFWSRLEGREVSLKEAEEYNRNLADYFDLLYKWDLELKKNSNDMHPDSLK